MYTYNINYGVSVGPYSNPPVRSVTAENFTQENGFLVFTDDTGVKVLAVPVALNPVVVMVETPVIPAT